MKRRRPAPRRRLRSEVLTLVAVLSLSSALAGLFPRAALFSRARASADLTPPEPGCAFVTLSPADEAAALARARTSWQQGAQRHHANLEMLPPTLPAALPMPAVALADDVAVPGFTRASPSVGFLPPSCAAPPPATIPADGASDPQPAFPRALMLRLDSSVQKGK